MSPRKTPFVPGEYYHLYNRGNSNQVIFRDEYDYIHFIKLLYLSNTRYRIVLRDLVNEFNVARLGQRVVYIGAYSLMPDHFDLIIAVPENGNISKFMQRLLTAYSMYFNAKYSHSGSLFEGKFKSKYISSNRYLRYLFSYVLLNPLKLIYDSWPERRIEDKGEAVEFLSKYEYSCFCGLVDPKRKENKVIDRGRFPDYFYKSNTIKNDIFEWARYDVKGIGAKKQNKKKAKRKKKVSAINYEAMGMEQIWIDCV